MFPDEYRDKDSRTPHVNCRDNYQNIILIGEIKFIEKLTGCGKQGEKMK